MPETRKAGNKDKARGCMFFSRNNTLCLPIKYYLYTFKICAELS